MLNIQDQIKSITGMYCMDDMEDFLNADGMEGESLQVWLDSNSAENSFEEDDYFDMEH